MKRKYTSETCYGEEEPLRKKLKCTALVLPVWIDTITTTIMEYLSWKDQILFSQCCKSIGFYLKNSLPFHFESNVEHFVHQCHQYLRDGILDDSMLYLMIIHKTKALLSGMAENYNRLNYLEYYGSSSMQAWIKALHLDTRKSLMRIISKVDNSYQQLRYARYPTESTIIIEATNPQNTSESLQLTLMYSNINGDQKMIALVETRNENLAMQLEITCGKVYKLFKACVPEDEEDNYVWIMNQLYYRINQLFMGNENYSLIEFLLEWLDLPMEISYCDKPLTVNDQQYRVIVNEEWKEYDTKSCDMEQLFTDFVKSKTNNCICESEYLTDAALRRLNAMYCDKSSYNVPAYKTMFQKNFGQYDSILNHIETNYVRNKQGFVVSNVEYRPLRVSGSYDLKINDQYVFSVSLSMEKNTQKEWIEQLNITSNIDHHYQRQYLNNTVHNLNLIRDLVLSNYRSEYSSRDILSILMIIGCCVEMNLHSMSKHSLKISEYNHCKLTDHIHESSLLSDIQEPMASSAL
jgi:hypothetical protein